MYDIMPWLPEKWRTVHRQVLRGESMRHERDQFEREGGKGAGWLKWSCAPWRDANGDIGGLIIMHEDVTRIVRAQHEVESSKERMAFGMSMTRMMIWEIDFDAREVFLEGDWTAFFPERPTYDLLTGGETWIHPGDRDMFANRWRAHMAGGPPYTAEYRVTLPDGRDIWHSASIRILKTVKGSPARAFAVIQDITARKQVEAKAMEAEQRALVAGAAKSDFLSNMSHEIRTPLNGVLAVSEVLARTPLDEQAVRDGSPDHHVWAHAASRDGRPARIFAAGRRRHPVRCAALRTRGNGPPGVRDGAHHGPRPRISSSTVSFPRALTACFVEIPFASGRCSAIFSTTQ